MSVQAEAAIAAPPASIRPMPSNWRVLRKQVAYQLRLFLRYPAGVFFTVALPLIMLVLFNSIFAGKTMNTPGGEPWPIARFYTGALAAFSAVAATYTNMVVVIPMRRADGILKRWRSTPVATWVYLGGWVVSAVMVAFVGVVIQLSVGVIFYGVTLDPAKLPAMLVTFVVGMATFAALGLTVASLVPDPDSAPAVANATLLPLAFVSDVFIPLYEPLPLWIKVLGDAFPLKALVNSFQDTLDPWVAAPGFDWPRLAFIAAWGVVGAFLASRTFTWEPNGGTKRT